MRWVWFLGLTAVVGLVLTLTGSWQGPSELLEVQRGGVSGLEEGMQLQERMGQQLADKELANIRRVSDKAMSDDPDANIHFSNNAAKVVRHHLKGLPRAAAAAHQSVLGGFVKHHLQLAPAAVKTVHQVETPGLKTVQHDRIMANGHDAAKGVEISGPAVAHAKGVGHVGAGMAGVVKKVAQMKTSAPDVHEHVHAPRVHATALSNKDLAHGDKAALHKQRAVVKKSKLDFIGEGPWTYVPTKGEMSGAGVGADHDGANGVVVDRWWKEPIVDGVNHSSGCAPGHLSPAGCDTIVGVTLDRFTNVSTGNASVEASDTYGQDTHAEDGPTVYTQAGTSHHLFRSKRPKQSQALHQLHRAVAQEDAMLAHKRAQSAKAHGLLLEEEHEAVQHRHKQLERASLAREQAAADREKQLMTARQEAAIQAQSNHAARSSLAQQGPQAAQALYEQAPAKIACIGGAHGVCADDSFDVYTDRREGDIGVPAADLRQQPYMFAESRSRPLLADKARLEQHKARLVQLSQRRVAGGATAHHTRVRLGEDNVGMSDDRVSAKQVLRSGAWGAGVHEGRGSVAIVKALSGKALQKQHVGSSKARGGSSDVAKGRRKEQTAYLRELEGGFEHAVEGARDAVTRLANDNLWADVWDNGQRPPARKQTPNQQSLATASRLWDEVWAHDPQGVRRPTAAIGARSALAQTRAPATEGVRSAKQQSQSCSGAGCGGADVRVPRDVKSEGGLGDKESPGGGTLLDATSMAGGGSSVLARPSYLDGGRIHHGIDDDESAADMDNFFNTLPQG